MIANLRQDFNNRFEAAAYQRLLAGVKSLSGIEAGFRIAETPAFFPYTLLREMADVGAELTYRLVNDAAYLHASSAAIPEPYQFPEMGKHPHFMTADFGLVSDFQGGYSQSGNAGGGYRPQLVELQAFPSVYAFQVMVSNLYRDTYELGDELRFFLGGHTEASFWELFSRVILNGHDPENVVLTETEPRKQKTLIDFLLTARHLGIQIVDIADLVPIGNKLHYPRSDGRLVPVHRIYNRAIVDELIRKQVKLQFDCRDQFDVEWAGHPNWYFQISKYSLPYLDHAAVPPAAFLTDWFAGPGKLRLNAGPGPSYPSLLLKPLFSFAGKGIEFDPDDSMLASIPQDQHSNYLLQQRVTFARVIKSPHGETQPEIRILYIWPDGGNLEPVMSLVRLGRGKMMGVDHNRDLEWVGASAGFFPTE